MPEQPHAVQERDFHESQNYPRNHHATPVSASGPAAGTENVSTTVARQLLPPLRFKARVKQARRHLSLTAGIFPVRREKLRFEVLQTRARHVQTDSARFALCGQMRGR